MKIETKYFYVSIDRYGFHIELGDFDKEAPHFVLSFWIKGFSPLVP